MLPGLLVVAFLCGSILPEWHRIELVYGAESLGEMATSLFGASFYELNPNIVNPLLRGLLPRLPLFLMIALLCGFVLRAASLASFDGKGKKIRRELGQDEVVAFGLVLGAILTFTIFLHWAMHLTFGVLLPKERTAIFLLPILSLMAGCFSSERGIALRIRWCGGLLRGVLGVVAVYFLLCGRLTYFKEWKYDADTRAAYDVLAYYYHAYGIYEAATNWRYTSSLNYYAATSGRESFQDFATSGKYPVAKSIYVLYWPEDEAFFFSQNLEVVYRGQLSNIAVAVRPGLARRQ